MKDPSIYYMGDQPYDHYGEYLEDLFDVLLYQAAGQKIVFLENHIEDWKLDIKQNLSEAKKECGRNTGISSVV